MANRKRIFWSSDLHIGHAGVIKFSNRPFRDVDHMHQILLNNFNAMLTDHTVLYILGDVGLCSSDIMSKFIRQLKGTKVLVLGNHDKKLNAMYNIGFDVVLNNATMQIAGEIVSMSHCPLLGVFREDTTNMRGSDGTENWHGESRKKARPFTMVDNGQFHLQGHIHSPNGGKSRRELHRQYDIGVDSNNYRPVSISQIESWIARVKQKENNWKDIPNFEGYKVNEFGQIKSFKRYPKGKLIKPYTDKDGYLCASLRVNNKSKAIKVHRAVALAFLPNPNNLPQVNHKNCHKKDNELCNLEWVSNTENQRHAWMNDRKTIKLTVENVKLIKELLKQGKTNTEISKMFEVDQTTISNIKTGKIWKKV